MDAQRRAAGLDGLRGLAALSVFGFHIYLYGRDGRATSDWEWIPMRLSVGLTLFFVLSGFLLYRSFERAARAQREPVSTSRYFIRRAARILPAYWVCLILVYPLMLAAEPQDGVRLPAAGDLWVFAVMGQNYSPDTILKLNSVTWTLVVEVAFYALLPLAGAFAYHVARGRRRPQVGLALAAIAIGLGWSATAQFAGIESQVFTKALPALLPYFALGILGALLVGWRAEQGGPRLSARATAALVVAGAALVLGDGYWHATGLTATMAVVGDLLSGVGFALAIVAVASGSGRWASWAAVRPVALLGLVSYGVYLWHLPVILYLQHLGVQERLGLEALAGAALAATLALGAASWRFIERPLIERARGPARERAPAAVAAARQW